MSSAHAVRFYSRVAIVGFWGLLVGGVAVFVATKVLAGLEADQPTGTTTPVVGMALASLVAVGLEGTVDAGVVSMGCGGVVMLFGVRLFASSLY